MFGTRSEKLRKEVLDLPSLLSLAPALCTSLVKIGKTMMPLLQARWMEEEEVGQQVLVLVQSSLQRTRGRQSQSLWQRTNNASESWYSKWNL